ncbi:hypothetical protein CUR178_05299 [Leishmania enriettii]|uniref:Uncharacterized protein n=1 Tax=Leishmania enriettii TaxID=5663 RepID=A0A836GRG8_LEIEN|nr:hypothetical protein CUR178_05299 [Leishmania enriettii]
MDAGMAAAASSLVLVDMGAPLQECLRCLCAQTARVAASLTAEQQHTLPGGTATPSVATLLSEYRAAASDTLGGLGNDTAQLRRRIALKLQRLQKERHIDLCSSAACADEVDSVIAELPTVAAGAQTLSEAFGDPVKTSACAPPLSPVSRDAYAVQEEEDDIFGWVTQHPSESVPATSEPAKSAAAPRHAATAAVAGTTSALAGELRSDEGTVDFLLRRIARDLADMVECKRRHAATVEGVHQQLITLQRYAESLLNVQEGGNSSTADSLGARLQRLLTYRPSHKIASEAEQRVWQRAWTAMGCNAAPVLEVGTSIETIDVAVLARSSVQRYETLEKRWMALRQAYEAQVAQLNQRMALAALQLGEIEAMRKPA